MWDLDRSDIQYVTWSSVGHGLLWVVDNNIFYMPDVSEDNNITMEDTGGKNTIFNGIPDWVYEGK